MFRFSLESAGDQGKRGYKTSDLPLNFWKVFELTPPSSNGASRLVVIPFIIKKKITSVEGKPKHEFLVDKPGKTKRSNDEGPNHSR